MSPATTSPGTASATRTVDIAIVGGGLVGASLACALAPLIEQHGLSVAVIEASPILDLAAAPWQPSFDARASAISLGTALHFTDMGCGRRWPRRPPRSAASMSASAATSVPPASMPGS